MPMNPIVADVIDVLKDVSSSAGVPVVTPALTGAFSVAQKVLEHSEAKEEDEKLLGDMDELLTSLDTIIGDPSMSSQILIEKHQHLQLLLQDITDQYRKLIRIPRRTSPTKRNSKEERRRLAEKVGSYHSLRKDIKLLTSVMNPYCLTNMLQLLDCQVRATEELKGAISEIYGRQAINNEDSQAKLDSIRSISTEAHEYTTNAVKNVTQAIPAIENGLYRMSRQIQQIFHSRDRDENGIKYIYRDMIQLQQTIRVGGVSYTLGNLRPEGTPVMIREYSKRNRRFTTEMQHLSRYSHPNLFQLIGYSPTDPPFLALDGGYLTGQEMLLQFQDDFLKSHWQLRFLLQVLSAFNYLEIYHENWDWTFLREAKGKFGILPIFDAYGRVKLDINVLPQDGVVNMEVPKVERRAFDLELCQLLHTSMNLPINVSKTEKPTILLRFASEVRDILRRYVSTLYALK